MLSLFYGHMLMVSGDLAGLEARLDDADRALAAVPDSQSRARRAGCTRARSSMPRHTADVWPVHGRPARGDVRPHCRDEGQDPDCAGQASEAADWARDRGVSATDDVSYLHEFDHLTLVRLLLAQDREHHTAAATNEAAGLLVRLRGAAEASGRAGSLLGIGMLQALANDAPGQRQQALETLAKPLPWLPNPMGTSGFSWTRAPP